MSKKMAGFEPIDPDVRRTSERSKGNHGVGHSDLLEGTALDLLRVMWKAAL